MNITKIATIGILTSTAAGAAFAGPDDVPVALGVQLGTALGRVLGSAMGGVDFLLGNGPLLGVTIASLLLAIVIARRKLGR